MRESRRQNNRTTEENTPVVEDNANDEENLPDFDEDEDDTIRQSTANRKRKRKQQAAVAKSKGSQKTDILGKTAYKSANSLPGQMANCDLCEKRFTVTPYSKTGPNGGLLCTPCSKEMANEEKKSKPRGPKKGGRQRRSNLLDGIVQRGAFSLLEMCIKVKSCPVISSVTIVTNIYITTSAESGR